MHRVHLQYAETQLKAMHDRKARRRSGRRPSHQQGGTSQSKEEESGSEFDETGRLKDPKLKILALVDDEPGDDDEDESPDGSPKPSLSSPRESLVARKAAARALEHKLVHNAYKTAVANEKKAKELLANVPEEVLSGDSQFDLASFMRRIEDK